MYQSPCLCSVGFLHGSDQSSYTASRYQGQCIIHLHATLQVCFSQRSHCCQGDRIPLDFTSVHQLVRNRTDEANVYSEAESQVLVLCIVSIKRRRLAQASQVLEQLCIQRFGSSGQKLPLVRMSAIWFWCQHMDLGFQVVSVKQPIKSNSVSFRHMSHCGTSSFDYHFDHCFIVFQNVQLRLSLRRMCVGGYAVHFALFINFLSSCDMLGLGFEIKNCPSFLEAGMFGLSFCLWLNVKLQSRCHKDQEQVTHPHVVQHPAKRLQILKNRAKPKFVRHMTILTIVIRVMNTQNISLASRLSHGRVHFVTDLASLFTDHKMSGRPIRSKYTHFKTICEQTSDNSPTDSSSSFLKW